MNHLESARVGVAPRLGSGWQAVQEVLDDGLAHHVEELRLATYERGNLTTRTVQNLLADAVKAGLVVVDGRGVDRTWRRP